MLRLLQGAMLCPGLFLLGSCGLTLMQSALYLVYSQHHDRVTHHHAMAKLACLA